jgi:hypothetical protein
MSDPSCPECNEDLDRIEVDIGVGIEYGPYGCPSCGWSADTVYNRLAGTNLATQADPKRWVDQWGVSHSRKRLREGLERFGLGALMEELFEEPAPDPTRSR